MSATTATIQRKGIAAHGAEPDGLGGRMERPSIDKILRGLALMRSLAGHDPAILRVTIEAATRRLAADGHPDRDVQRLRNYARTMTYAPAPAEHWTLRRGAA